MMEKFKKELENLINRHCIENKCDMPDFILAEMICGIIKEVGFSVKKTLDWHGCDSICHPKKIKTQKNMKGSYGYCQIHSIEGLINKSKEKN